MEQNLQNTFASLWLSRLAIAAVVLYISCAIKLWRIKSKVSKIASLLCTTFAVWALQAGLSYATPNPELTVFLSKLLSWSWPLYPAIGVHFTIEIYDTSNKINKKIKTFWISFIYFLAVIFYYLLAFPLLRGAIWRGGYWSVDIKEGLGLVAFNSYYILANLTGMTLLIIQWLKSKNRRTKKGYRILIFSELLALTGGVITDTVLAALKIDCPKVGCLWASCWVMGLLWAIERYDFLAPFSSAEKVILLDEFMARSCDAIIISDSANKILYWNKACEEITGVSNIDAIGKDLAQTLQDRLPQKPNVESIRNSIKKFTESAKKTGIRLELQIVSVSGEKKWIQSDPFFIPTFSGDTWVYCFRNVTVEKQQNKETLDKIRHYGHQQKMEALGSLAGGIAHDFNNTLAGILGATSLIKSTLEEDSTKYPDFSVELDIINKSAQRAAASVRGLLAFTSKNEPKYDPFNLCETVQNVIDFFRRSKSDCINIDFNKPNNKAMCIGDSPQIEQVLLNLMINAEHAMTIMRPNSEVQGGTITVKIQKVIPNPLFVSNHPDADSIYYWTVSIKDEGIGIDSKVISKVFAPFFTTKMKNKGSGLGLAMAQLIANQHFGFINVESELGQGSVFTLFLPTATEALIMHNNQKNKEKTAQENKYSFQLN